MWAIRPGVEQGIILLELVWHIIDVDGPWLDLGNTDVDCVFTLRSIGMPRANPVVSVDGQEAIAFLNLLPEMF